MTAQMQTPGFDDLFDMQAAAARWSESGRQAAEHLLDLFQKSVGQLADTQLQTARSMADPTLVTFVESQAALSRDVVDAYVTSVRKLLEL
jgi:hypothetical protein